MGCWVVGYSEGKFLLSGGSTFFTRRALVTCGRDVVLIVGWTSFID